MNPFAYFMILNLAYFKYFMEYHFLYTIINNKPSSFDTTGNKKEIINIFDKFIRKKKNH